MRESTSIAADLHKNVPPDWYYRSIKRNPFQWLWHKIRFYQVGRHIEPAAGMVLDIGSADGVFTKIIADKTAARKVIGIDVLASSVAWAGKHWKRQKNMRFEAGDAHELRFKANSFDSVFVLEVMEHVADPDKVLRQIKKVLKKGGYAIILVPTDSFLFRVVWFFVSHFWWAKIWEDCHIQSFNGRNRIARHARKIGFKIEQDKKFWLGMLNLVKIRK